MLSLVTGRAPRSLPPAPCDEVAATHDAGGCGRPVMSCDETASVVGVEELKA